MRIKAFLFSLIFIMVMSSFGFPAEVKSPDPAKDDFTLAQKAFEDRFYDISQEQLERFLAIYPQSDHRDEAHLILGRSYLMLGKNAQALNEFDLVLSSASAKHLYDEAVYWSAEVYFRGKDFKQALDRPVYRFIVKMFGGSG